MDAFRMAMMGNAGKPQKPAPKPTPNPDTACVGCGTCCRKGGPALHSEDAALFAAGAFSRADLVTVRAGELAFDQVSGALLPLDSDIVKFGDGRIRNSHGFMVSADDADCTQAAGLSGCRFLEEMPKTATGAIRGQCGVYAHRPVECHALLCKDTRAIEALYNKDRLDRAAILLATFDTDKQPYAQALIELIKAHTEACSATSWHALLQELAVLDRTLAKADSSSDAIADTSDNASNDASASKADALARKAALQADLAEACRLDTAYRELAHEKASVPLNELAFLFGRPLPHVALSYGVRM